MEIETLSITDKTFLYEYLYLKLGDYFNRNKCSPDDIYLAMSMKTYVNMKSVDKKILQYVFHNYMELCIELMGVGIVFDSSISGGTIKICPRKRNTPYYVNKKEGTIEMPEIKKVIFNNPATIVFWNDGSKTIVKVQKGEEYDKEKGLAMAISKKALGNKGNYNDIFKKYI